MRYNRLYKDNNFLTPTTYTQTLSEYTETLRYEDIPADVVERAKMIMLQTVGAALAAKGETVIEDCRHIERGYEDICRDLSALGARIQWIGE